MGGPGPVPVLGHGFFEHPGRRYVIVWVTPGRSLLPDVGQRRVILDLAALQRLRLALLVLPLGCNRRTIDGRQSGCYAPDLDPPGGSASREGWVVSHGWMDRRAWMPTTRPRTACTSSRSVRRRPPARARMRSARRGTARTPARRRRTQATRRATATSGCGTTSRSRCDRASP